MRMYDTRGNCELLRVRVGFDAARGERRRVDVFGGESWFLATIGAEVDARSESARTAAAAAAAGVIGVGPVSIVYFVFCGGRLSVLWRLVLVLVAPLRHPGVNRCAWGLVLMG
ncbi:hypothetical protein PLESTB_001393900 [Pleodorina starrii]|uniref:Uncharacterized protein n=1 Tax=Pleodorina starrii TaxID=330485 RepID=A0A9W6F7J9_9CHLO|nr:hypothetical protein PLESTM_000538400 [Pleodorina starrii]GLC58725.1 hypothetical protein PLESTB_001393900 [Pleodorina starrii]GLC75189.1 hypothetical protein PLESTF_001605100 [Pleodorina starrii]